MADIKYSLNHYNLEECKTTFMSHRGLLLRKCGGRAKYVDLFTITVQSLQTVVLYMNADMF